jgi:uncharacterized protein (TIGR00304 family)
MRIDKVFMGFALMFMGIALLMLSTANANVQYGGVVIIRPIPIVFGSSVDMAVFGVFLAVFILMAILLLMRW